MKEHFEVQLNNLNPISEDTIDLLSGKSFYSDYQVGDKVCIFGNVEPQKTKEGDKSNTASVNISLRTIVERDFDKLDEEFLFIRFNETIPYLIKKGLEKEYMFKGKILL